MPFSRRALPALACAGALWATAFVAAPPRAAKAPAPAQASLAAPQAAAGGAASEPMSAMVVGVWAVAGLCAALPRTALRAQEKDKEEDKKPFNVWEPDTYGNISMDDVKKYGAAGTLSYVITELLFWAIAFPTECIVYLNTAGHWPDFSKPEEQRWLQNVSQQPDPGFPFAKRRMLKQQVFDEPKFPGAFVRTDFCSPSKRLSHVKGLHSRLGGYHLFLF